MHEGCERRRVSYTDEVDDESPVGESAAGMTKVRLTVRESASRLCTIGEEDQVSGVGERVAESEDGGVTAAASSREDQQLLEPLQLGAQGVILPRHVKPLGLKEGVAKRTGPCDRKGKDSVRGRG
ncbi:hypothetical protein C4D60_Mb08t09750 [Musa balbisiana]|uniref:Uncharacterized protein n=1 Tax=Musa balbisiana TaxID=52838 RepID=A0A4S8K2L0_MUSBA|nr:hypothetical protein C4D60_Mb08t09750 [Musa balbisiana]